jgi:hypothetical protein
MKDFNYCKECGEKLKEVKIIRTKPLSCSNCRGNSQNHAFRQIMKECAEMSQEEEGRFEDIEHDPEERIMMKSRPTNHIGVRSSLNNF